MTTVTTQILLNTVSSQQAGRASNKGQLKLYKAFRAAIPVIPKFQNRGTHFRFSYQFVQVFSSKRRVRYPNAQYHWKFQYEGLVQLVFMNWAGIINLAVTSFGKIFCRKGVAFSKWLRKLTKLRRAVVASSIFLAFVLKLNHSECHWKTLNGLATHCRSIFSVRRY